MDTYLASSGEYNLPKFIYTINIRDVIVYELNSYCLLFYERAISLNITLE